MSVGEFANDEVLTSCKIMTKHYNAMKANLIKRVCVPRAIHVCTHKNGRSAMGIQRGQKPSKDKYCCGNRCQLPMIHSSVLQPAALFHWDFELRNHSHESKVGKNPG